MLYKVAAFPDRFMKTCRIVCPLCGRIHVHGYGEGSRSPHCLSGFRQDGDNYELIIVRDPFPQRAADMVDRKVKHNQDVIIERHERHVTVKGSMKPNIYYRAQIAALLWDARKLNREYVDRELLWRALPGDERPFPLGVRQAW